MALFPSDNVRPEEEASRRRSVTQEVGTRRLVIGFVGLVVLWLVGSRLQDAYLLRKSWAQLAPDAQGLSVVGTLDRRGSYDRNLFRIVQIEGDARAELTNFGWASIFSGQHGRLSEDHVGTTIETALKLDSEAGYAMLAPFIAAQVRLEMGDAHAYDAITPACPIDTALPMTKAEKAHRPLAKRTRALGQLLDYFAKAGQGPDRAEGSDEGGTGSEHQVEHGLAIPGDVLVQSCPIVLTGRHFTRGWVEEHPEVVMGGKTYSVWLDLTPEGRSRFYQWSHAHLNEHLLLVLNGKVVANGRMQLTMDVPTWEITNLRDGAAAHTLVDFVNAHGRRP